MNDPVLDSRWAWIQYIPLKLHKIGAFAGGFLGAVIGSNFDAEGIGAAVGFILGAVPGIYLQVLKRKYQRAN